MNLVDTHCHVHAVNGGEAGTQRLWAKLGLSAAELVKRADRAGVKQLICVGTDLADSQLACNFAGSSKGCFAAVGVHPHEAKRYTDRSKLMPALTAAAHQPKVVAIGECGLDYFYDHSQPADQAAILRCQLELAGELKLPVIFHVREAFADFWPILDSYKGLKGVLHSFTDSAAVLDQALSRKLLIGVNGIATFAKSPESQAMYKQIPRSSLLLETDAPYLTPTPYRGSVNEPKYIARIIEYLSELRGESVADLAAATTANAHLLFAL